MTGPGPERRELERLSAADASNIELDAPDQVNAFLLAGILGTGGFIAGDGTADLDRLRTVLAERLGERRGRHLRRFGQRVDVTRRPLVWEHCEPDLTWHVRLVDAVDGRILRLTFTGGDTYQPLLGRVARETGIDYTILAGRIDRIKDTPYGQLTVSLVGGDQNAAQAAFVAAGVHVEELRR